MKRKKSLARRLLARGRRSVLRVDRRSKKAFRRLGRAQGLNKKTLRAALRRYKAAARPEKGRAVKAASAEIPAPEESGGLSLGALLALCLGLGNVLGQLRTTGGRGLRRKMTR